MLKDSCSCNCRIGKEEHDTAKRVVVNEFEKVWKELDELENEIKEMDKSLQKMVKDVADIKKNRSSKKAR